VKRDKLAARLREESLGGGGKVSLSMLIESLIPVKNLRDLAREHGVSPKGGYRMERAPAKVLAPALCELFESEALQDVCELLADHMTSSLVKKKNAEAEADAEKSRAPAHLEPVLKLKEQELEQAKAEVEKAREVAQGLRDRVDESNRRVHQHDERLTLLVKEIEACREEIERLGNAQPVVARDQSIKILSLEKELEEQNQIELQQRIKLAEQAAEIRERDERIAELEELVPSGRKRKKKKLPKPPENFAIPHFTPAFLKSLIGKDRRAVEHAYRAVFLFCTEGSRHPGLQVKSLDPSSVWSLRASRKLRVYFRRQPDGDVEILELLDRQEQDTMLRRYREKQ
jgi:hypothetical protein